MASVTSLGPHRPTGLQHAIDEEMLPEDADEFPSSGWETVSGDGGDELLVTRSCVLWSRGGIFQKSFSFELEKEPVKHALLTYFPASESGRDGNATEKNGSSRRENVEDGSRLAKALVVFLKTQAHVFFLSGTSHVIHLPFEVESVCAAPRGLIIQRKQSTDAAAALSLRLPRVPPNSFVSSQPFTASQTQMNTQTTFSVDSLGRPPALPLRLGSTLENLWEPLVQPKDIRWPRLLSLTDPLLEFGMVVAAQPASDGAAKDSRRVSFGPSRGVMSVDPAEEILHIESIPYVALGAASGSHDQKLVLAVTWNRQAATYTVWRLTYLERADMFAPAGRNGPLPRCTPNRSSAAAAAKSSARRRSSMKPPADDVDDDGRNPLDPAPAVTNNRRSTSRKVSDRSTGGSSMAETLLDAADKEAAGGMGVSRRTSRRVSSMLARADLSAHHQESFSGAGVQGASQGRAGASFVGGGVGPAGLSTLREGPGAWASRSLLDDARGSDLEGTLQGMGLDDDGGLPLSGGGGFFGEDLAQEVLLTKIRSVPVENSNVRYSMSDTPARSQCRVFVLVAPPFAVSVGEDEDGTSSGDGRRKQQILVGIQDPVEKRLQLLTLYARPTAPRKGRGSRKGKPDAPSAGGQGIELSWGHLRKAQSVLDSCKLTDGDVSAILILSRTATADRSSSISELSVQAPWSQCTMVTVRQFPSQNLRSLDFRGSRVAKAKKNRESMEGFASNRKLVGLRHPLPGGLVSVVDEDGRTQQIRIQLEPRNPLVRRVLDACRSVLPPTHAERMLSGWWQVMQWTAAGGRLSSLLKDKEWSALTIELFVVFLALGLPDDFNWQEAHAAAVAAATQRPRTASSGSRGRDSWEGWDAMAVFEGASPAWAQSPAWQWTLPAVGTETERLPVFDTSPVADRSSISSGGSSGAKRLDFISRHVDYARQFALSELGIAAVGPSGYLPTACSRTKESRRDAARDLLMALHLLLEEAKLDVTSPEASRFGQAGLEDLRLVVCQIARWLRWDTFAAMYELSMLEERDSSHDDDFSISPPIPEPAIYPCILTWIQERLTSDTNAPFPTLADIYYSALGIPLAARTNDARWDSITPRTLTFLRLFRSLPPSWGASDLVEAMHKCGMDVGFLDTLPEAVLAPLQDAVCIVQVNPPISWPKDLLGLVNRGDITLVREPGKKPRIPHVNLLAPTHVATWDYQLLCQSVDDFNSVGYDEGEGTERQAVVRALFKDDRRLNEAQSLLSTHKAQVVRLDAQPSWSESYYLEKQKELVARMATGTLAIPAGRAMLYYGLRFPLLTQKFHIGGFNLSCVVKPTNVTVGVDRSLFTEEKVCWAFFHQGVAAGLAISPQAKGIDTSWILYNKPGQDLSNRHAGFLLALGLNGHLRSVAKWVAFKYLTPKHTMTSIGLLLGLAASYLGTMDSLVTRLLSVHVTRMLPRGAADLNLSPLTQTTGIMGIGLLYCSSQHRRMSEIMVSELEYIEEEDEEEPLRSECYRLAAGFALGFINLGRGADLRGLHDMKLTERLLTLASAPKKVEFVHVLDRSTAAATIAITLIFMKSEDQIVARKIDVPDSVLQFDYVRPDVLLLRTVAKNLILWSQITPTFDWIRDSLPGPYQHRHRNLSANARQKSRPARVTADIPFFSILAGLCLAIGLRFAGSADLRARDLLVHYLDAFMALAKPGPDQNSIPEGDEEAAAAVAAGGMPRHDVRAAVDCARNCQDVVALAAAAVMAGTGDLVVLRRLRSLHGRDHHPAPSELDAVNGAPDAGGNATTYGSHMAAHLAIGALFLGCGTATFGTSDLAVAALLAAFYPVFPTSVTDNQAHLQAFRHFWVLATDNRCLVTKDLSTGLPVSVPVEIRLKKTQRPDADKDAPAVLRRTTPCLLPPLETIENVRTDAGPAFWDLTIDFSSNRNDKDKLSTKSSKAHGASSTTREPQPPLDSFRITRPQQSVYLRRRPAREHPFAATLRALGHRGGAVTSRASKGGQIRASTGNPLEWVLSAAAPLRTLTHTERAIVLGADAATASVGTTPGGVPSSGGAGGGGAFGAGHTSGSEPAGAVGVASSTAVDARLVLETAVGGWRATGSASPGIHDDDGDSGGAGVGRHQSRPAVPLEASRDELLGLRLLFAWAEKRRERLLASSGTRAEEHDGTGDVDGGEQDGSGWWLRDSVVEMLKGRVWLAAREEDED